MSDQKPTLPAQTLSAALASITGDSKVDINDITNVYVSRYEANLQAAFKECQAQIKELRAKQSTLQKSIIDAAVVKVREANLSSGNFTVVVGSKTSNIKKVSNMSTYGDEGKIAKLLTCDEVVEVSANVVGNFGKNATGIDTSFTTYVEVSHEDSVLLKSVADELSTAQSALSDINSKMQNISAQDRAIRGKLSELRLKEIGVDVDVTQIPELVALISI